MVCFGDVKQHFFTAKHYCAYICCLRGSYALLSMDFLIVEIGMNKYGFKNFALLKITLQQASAENTEWNALILLFVRHSES